MKILALDDDRNFLEELATALSDEHSIELVTSPSDLFRSIEQRTPDVLLLDMHMPEMSGLQILRLLRGRRFDFPIVMLTGDSNSESIVLAMKYGANDYVSKSAEDLLLSLRVRLSKIEAMRTLSDQNALLVSKLAESAKSYEILGISQPILRQRLEIQRFKGSSIYVLIEGENGTGKELVARNLNLQEGTGRPFVAVNCGAIPVHLIESELFGHVRGAFTGAVSDQKGRFLAANGGDIFLDEIGEMPLDMQVKLLRALQEKTITPVGSTKSIPIQVRVISATNRRLEDLVNEGKFRQDLFFRINQVTLRTPPLRERREDILFLAELFAERAKAGLRFSDAAKADLLQHTWPGNIRELQNTVERACLFARDSIGTHGASEILPEHLSLSGLRPEGWTCGAKSEWEVPAEFLPATAGDVTREQYQRCVDWVQRRFFEAALKILKDNDRVIEQLQMSRSYFYQRKKELGVAPQRGIL